MTKLNEHIPEAVAPKTGGDFIKFEPLPTEGPTVMTVVAVNFIPDHEATFSGETKRFNAVELILGTEEDGKAYFLKTYPMNYSLAEKAKYRSVYKHALGRWPVAGTKASDMIGAALTVSVENQDKVSKKGTPYRVSKATAFSPVHPKLAQLATPVAKLRPILDQILANADSAGGDKADDMPF